MCVQSARLLAFREGIFGTAEFIETDATAPPTLLLDNPHLLSEKILSATVVFVHASPTLLRRMVPLLARLTEGNTHRGDDDNTSSSRKVEIVTLVHHIDSRHTIEGHVRDVEGTELRVYDRIDSDDAPAPSISLPPPPEPAEDFDRQFARSSILFALPQQR